MPNKYVIGLTGNIATGKSLVLHMLEELGAYTIDADDLAHVLMRRGGPLYDSIVKEFGRNILGKDVEIDRGKLGSIVFCDPQALSRLDAVTHPSIKQVIRQLVAGAEASVVVIEAIKLIESSIASDCDVVWVVVSPEDAQIERLMTRSNMSREQALSRVEAQAPQDEKVARADVVIDNSGDVLKTWQSVRRQFAQIPKTIAFLPEEIATDELMESLKVGQVKSTGAVSTVNRDDEKISKTADRETLTGNRSNSQVKGL
jgi:dephospho-CoA kinase